MSGPSIYGARPAGPPPAATADLPSPVLAESVATPAHRRSPAPGRLRALALLAGALAAGAVVFLFDPATAGFFPSCPFRRLTGLLCPGCGATRALHQLLHGRVAPALALNPLLPLYLAALGWVLLAQVRDALGRPTLAAPQGLRRQGVALLVLVLAFWVARNLPGWPLPQAAGG